MTTLVIYHKIKCGHMVFNALTAQMLIFFCMLNINKLHCVYVFNKIINMFMHPALIFFVYTYQDYRESSIFY